VSKIFNKNDAEIKPVGGFSCCFGLEKDFIDLEIGLGLIQFKSVPQSQK
jgi:hypothetical protein